MRWDEFNPIQKVYKMVLQVVRMTDYYKKWFLFDFGIRLIWLYIWLMHDSKVIKVLLFFI